MQYQKLLDQEEEFESIGQFASLDQQAYDHLREEIPLKAFSNDQHLSDDDVESNSNVLPLEVSSVVLETDDPKLPTLTGRFWILSTVLTILIAAAAQFFFFRLVSLTLSLYIIQMVSFPIGVFLAKVIPRHPFWNPGPFNSKEHCLICISASTATSAAYAIDILTVQRIYYNQNIGAISSLLLLWTTQCIGYGIAGYLKKYLVEPKEMIWPIILPNIAVFNTLHNPSSSSSPISRQKYKFFFVVLVLTALYQLLPFVAPILTWISFICIIGGKGLSSFWATLAGGVSNGGFLNISLDWSAVGGSYPLYAPLWAQMNEFCSKVFFNWFFIPILVYFNTWGARHYPMFGFHTRVPFPNSTNVDIGLPTFTNRNNISFIPEFADGYQILPSLNTSYILFSNITLNEERYKNHGPMLLSPWWAISYGCSFGALTATLVHIYLFHGSEIKRNMFKKNKKKNIDVHTRLMNVYEDVPKRWYAAIFGSMIILSIITIEFVAYPHLQLRWWGLLLAICLALLFVLPVGILTAVTGTGVGLNVLTEMIIGFISPGQPIANIVFKTYGYMAMSQCLNLVSDQKLGHYMKTPPKSLFVAQLWGTILGCVTNYTVMELILGAIDFKNGKDPQWSARNTATFYNASLIWGLVGPQKLFGFPEGYYHKQMIWFIVGAILPCIVYYFAKRYPNSNWNYVNIPIILNATNSNINGAHMWISAISVAIWSHWHMKHNHPHWYKHFNFILGAALDTGTTIAVVVGFLFIKMPAVELPKWFLNPSDTSDYCYNSVHD